MTDPDDTTYTPHRPSREDRYHAWVEDLRRAVDEAKDHKKADDKPRCCLCGKAGNMFNLRRLSFHPASWICDSQHDQSRHNSESNT